MLGEKLAPTSKITIIQEVNLRLSELLKFAFDDYVALSNSLGKFHVKIKEFYNESGAYIDKNKIESLLGSLNQIIVDLQFHDIIRQKIEHIDGIHVALVKELETNIPQTEKNNYIDISNEICALSIAQLKFIDNEYQSHSNSIKNALQNGVGLEISALENFVFDFSSTFNHINAFAETIESIVKSLEEISTNKIVNANDKVLQLKERYTMRSEREVFNKVFNIEGDMEDENDDIELF